MAHRAELTDQQRETYATEKRTRLATYIQEHFPGAISLSGHAEEAVIVKQAQALCDLWRGELTQMSMREMPRHALEGDEIFIREPANGQDGVTEVIVPALLAPVIHVGGSDRTDDVILTGWAAEGSGLYAWSEAELDGVHVMACPALVYKASGNLSHLANLGIKAVKEWAAGNLGRRTPWALDYREVPNKGLWKELRSERCSWQYVKYEPKDYRREPPTQAKWIRRHNDTERTFVFDAGLTRAIHEHERREPHIVVGRH